MIQQVLLQLPDELQACPGAHKLSIQNLYDDTLRHHHQSTTHCMVSESKREKEKNTYLVEILL